MKDRVEELLDYAKLLRDLANADVQVYTEIDEVVTAIRVELNLVDEKSAILKKFTKDELIKELGKRNGAR